MRGEVLVCAVKDRRRDDNWGAMGRSSKRLGGTYGERLLGRGYLDILRMLDWKRCIGGIRGRRR